MNARELLDDLESGLIDEFMSAEVKAIYIRALRLLAAAEANDGSIPEMTKAVQEGRGIELGCQFERERNGLAARAVELEADAEMYRWLRVHSWLDSAEFGSPQIVFGAGYNQTAPEALDAAIDAERGKP